MTWDTIWQEAFTAQIAEQEEKTGTNPQDWRRGGRASKANPDKEDGAWWLSLIHISEPTRPY